MTFESMHDALEVGRVSPKQVAKDIQSKDKLKKIRYYVSVGRNAVTKLKPDQLNELNAIVNVLMILYNSVGSPIIDSEYDVLQELLIDMGIPRLTGSIDINDSSKLSHQHTNMRGTLGKVYYLTSTEKRDNKSRKTLDQWIASVEAMYRKKTGQSIDLNEQMVLLQPKFNGVCAVQDRVGKKYLWLSRGDTRNNLASDYTKALSRFNGIFPLEDGESNKFEIIIAEEDWEKINTFYREEPYSDARQIVTSILNSGDIDFKCDYLYPVPLREFKTGDKVEQIHPMLIENFPTLQCQLKDRETIRWFAEQHRYIKTPHGKRLDVDGVVITLCDENLKLILGRDRDINNFEVAYKFTEEFAYSRVKDIEFYVSEFGFITPVLVVNNIIIKGKVINHITLSNRDRFDELNLGYGDMVKVLYDIIPYATLDDECMRHHHGRKIAFTKVCPACKAPLDLSQTMVRCTNPDCVSVKIGLILNYCSSLRIKNVGYQTLKAIYDEGLLKNGIRSLYKLKKHRLDIEYIEGFGKTKTDKLIREIEAKRRLRDYQFFGAIGILKISTKTFQQIFASIKLEDFLNMIKLKNFSLLKTQLTAVKGVGDIKADIIVNYFKDEKLRKNFLKLLEEVTLHSSYSEAKRSRIVFTGCRPNESMEKYLASKGYEASDTWSKNAKFLVVPDLSYTSNKTSQAASQGVPVITIHDVYDVIEKEYGR